MTHKGNPDLWDLADEYGGPALILLGCAAFALAWWWS